MYWVLIMWLALGLIFNMYFQPISLLSHHLNSDPLLGLLDCYQKNTNKSISSTFVLIHFRCCCQIHISFSCGTGAWTQGFHLEPLHQPYFREGLFAIGSRELFPWVDFEPRSSWSLPPEKLGLQMWATGTWLYF
jgi:hypothetical protein